jgi:hypothetical protein
VLGAVLLPLYFIVRWRLRKKDAKQIAQKLLKLKETSIPLVELSNKIGMKKADVKVVDLKKHGFLQRIDIEDGKLLLDNVPLIEETKVEDSGTNINDAILHKIRYLNDEIDNEAFLSVLTASKEPRQVYFTR